MGTKNEPAAFDCYANAEPDEPMFVLLARDLTAPEAVELWATLRQARLASAMAAGTVGPDSMVGRAELAQIAEAREVAQAMREWRAANR